MDPTPSATQTATTQFPAACPATERRGERRPWPPGPPCPHRTTGPALAGTTRASAPEPGGKFARAREREAGVWVLGMAYQYPARYREHARTMLDHLEEGEPGP